MQLRCPTLVKILPQSDFVFVCLFVCLSLDNALPQALASPPPPPPLPTGSAGSGMVDLRELLQTAEANNLNAAEADLYSMEDYDDLLFGGQFACGLLAEYFVPAVQPPPAPPAQANPAILQVIPATLQYRAKLYSRRGSWV